MQETFDAVVVGSGASGGWVAMQLAEAGLKIAVLEAGRTLDPKVDFTEHKRPFEMPLRGRRLGPRESQLEQPMQSKTPQCDEYTHHLFIKDTENPISSPADRPFIWIRSRHVGGRSVTWGRQSYRLSDLDFKAASHDGFGIDWPLDYAELAPYYDRVERYVGISGQAEGLAQLPDGQFLPPMALTCGERHMRQVLKQKFGRTLTIGRTAVLTVPHNGRPPCHYCGPCTRGCITGSYYSSPATTLLAAERTGRMTLIPDAVVSHVELDDQGRCKSVYYIERVSRQHRELRAKVVVLCASALESTRILLNSRSARFANGLANSSGVLGHHLTDHVMGGGASGVLPMLKGVPDTRGRRPNGIYVPRFRNVNDRHPDFLRGYAFQGGASIQKWGHAFALPGFGAGFKQQVRETRAWTMNLSGFGECLSRFENFCELDKQKTDAWGIPVLHVNMAFGDNERRMCRDMSETAAEMLEAAGAEDIKPRNEISVPGFAIHELGTARMGNDPKTSVVNRWQQAHDVSNLFVMDGAVFPSAANQNPTLTIMALAARACDYLVEELRRGNL